MKESIGRIRRNGIAGRASKKKMALGIFPLVFKYSSYRDLIRALVFRHPSEAAFFACQISYNSPHNKSSERKLFKMKGLYHTLKQNLNIFSLNIDGLVKSPSTGRGRLSPGLGKGWNLLNLLQGAGKGEPFPASEKGLFVFLRGYQYSLHYSLTYG
jgi:hypothetical protein